LFYSITLTALYYALSPIFLGTNVTISALALSAMSLSIATLATFLPELKSVPQQFDPTGEGANWPEER